MVTYKGLPAPVICDFLSREASRAKYAPGVEFHIGRIDMVANTGTYVDAPFHRYAEGADLADLPLERLADLSGVVVDAPYAASRSLSADALRGLDLKGRALLVRTGWDVHWRTDRYFEGNPFLGESVVACLVEAGVAMVGIDSYNIDDVEDLRRPAHSVLLGAGIPVCEHLTGLQHLPREGFRFSAVPVKVRAFGTFPVRAWAAIDR